MLCSPRLSNYLQKKAFPKQPYRILSTMPDSRKVLSTCILRTNMTSETGSLPTKPGSYSTMPARNLKKTV